MKHDQITYDGGTIDYELIFSRRKTLGITVHANGRVAVRAPINASPAEVRDIVRKKSAWIRRKQRLFADQPPPPPPRNYTSGEKHLYLGRNYTLQVLEDRQQGVTLEDSRLILRARDAHDLPRKEKLLREWYRARAREIFSARLDTCHPIAARQGIPRPEELKIRLMKRRWGSCSSQGTILLNLRLVQTPVSCIDYVIIHELAHLKEHNHNAAFYALLDVMQPDWRARRDTLNKIAVA